MTDSSGVSGDTTRHGTEALARFLARNVDGLVVLAMSWVAFFIIGVVGAATIGVEGTQAALAAWQASPVISLVSSTFLFIVLSCLYDSVLISAFGTTLGKRLMGIGVATADCGRPGFAQVLKRSVLLWGLGLGLGIPIVTLATMVWSYTELENKGITRWDRLTRLRVGVRDVHPLRWSLAVLGWVAGIMLNVLGMAGGFTP